MSLKQATIVNAIAKYSVIVMNIVFSGILARLLTPDDYGIIAVMTIFTTFFSKISDMGFGTAIIQYQQLTREEINQIFSFTCFLAISLAVIFALLGSPISFFYDNTIYKKLCLFLSISVFFSCMNMIPNAVLLRNKDFIIVGVRTVIVNVIGYIIAIICAFGGWKYYALAVQSVISAMLNFFWNNYATKLKIVFKNPLTALKKVWKYSFFQFVFSWVNYFESNLDQILIGGFMGNRSLAYYDRSYKLVGYPLAGISGVITPVLHPVLKDYQDDKNCIYIKYIEIQKVLSCIACVITPIFAFASREIITILYGKQWEQAIIICQILCISIYPKFLMSTTGAVYCSAGNTKMLFAAGTINAIVTCIGIGVGICCGSINTVAIGVAVASWSNFFVTFIILIKKVLRKSVISYFKIFVGDFLEMIVLSGTLLLLTRWITTENIIISLFIKLCLVAIIYGGYLFISKRYKIIEKILLHKKN